MSEENNILNELREMQSPLADIPRQMPYAVPDEYFSAAQEQILMIPLEEILPGKSPAPYAVPRGYFEGLPQAMLTVAKKSAPVTKTYRAHWRVQWLQAAMLAIMISTGGYIMFGSGKHNMADHMLSSVPAGDIREYIDHRYGGEIIPVNDAHLSELKVEKKEIVSYLDETGWD